MNGGILEVTTGGILEVTTGENTRGDHWWNTVGDKLEVTTSKVLEVMIGEVGSSRDGGYFLRVISCRVIPLNVIVADKGIGCRAHLFLLTCFSLF